MYTVKPSSRLVNTFITSKGGKPQQKAIKSWSQSVYNKEVPLYRENIQSEQTHLLYVLYQYLVIYGTIL